MTAPTRDQCLYVLDGIFEATRDALRLVPLHGEALPATLQLFDLTGPGREQVALDQVLVVAELMTAQTKTLVPELIDALLIGGGVDVIAFVSEAWTVKAPRAEQQRIQDLINAGVRVADLPGAREVISVALSYVGGGVTVGYDVARSDDGTAELARGAPPVFTAGTGAMVPKATRALPEGRA